MNIRTTGGDAANDNRVIAQQAVSEVLFDIASLLAEAYITKLADAANDNRAPAREA